MGCGHMQLQNLHVRNALVNATRSDFSEQEKNSSKYILEYLSCPRLTFLEGLRPHGDRGGRVSLVVDDP